MFFAIVLAAALAAPTPQSAVPPKTAIAACFATMDGAVYNGDPSDRRLMQAAVATCAKGLALIKTIRTIDATQGPEKLFITGQILERAATLSFMGLGDAPTALREIQTANLYFRVASGLPWQSANYHEAALADVERTRIQLNTLRHEIALGGTRHSRSQLIASYHKL